MNNQQKKRKREEEQYLDCPLCLLVDEEKIFEIEEYPNLVIMLTYIFKNMDSLKLCSECYNFLANEELDLIADTCQPINK